MSKAKLDPQAIKLHTLGNKLVQEQKYNEAIANFEKAIQIEPEYAVAYQHLAETYEAKKLEDKAFTCYLKAITLNESLAMQHIDSGLYNLLSGPLGKAVVEYKKRKEASGELTTSSVGIATPKEGSPVDLATRPAVEKPRGQKGLKPLKIIVEPADEYISSDAWSVDHITATVLGDKDIPIIDVPITFRIVDDADMMDSFIAILAEKANEEKGPRKLKLKTDAEGKARIFFRRSKKTGLNKISIEVDGVESAVFEDNTRPLQVYSIDMLPQESYYRTAQQVKFQINVFDYFWNSVDGADMALYIQELRKDNGEWDVIDNANYKTDKTGHASHIFTMPTRGHLRCRFMAENKTSGFKDSVEFNVAPGSANSVIFIPGGGEVAAGGDFSLKVRMMDEYDNPIDGISARIVLLDSDNSEWTLGPQLSGVTAKDGSVIVKVNAPSTEGASAVFAVESEHIENPAMYKASFETVSADSPEVQKKTSPFGNEFDDEFDDDSTVVHETDLEPDEIKDSETFTEDEVSGLPDISDETPVYGDAYSHTDDEEILNEPTVSSSLDTLDISVDDSSDYLHETDDSFPADEIETGADNRFGDIPDVDQSFIVVESGARDNSHDDFYDDSSDPEERFGDISGSQSDEFNIYRSDDDISQDSQLNDDFSTSHGDGLADVPEELSVDENNYETISDTTEIHDTEEIYSSPEIEKINAPSSDIYSGAQSSKSDEEMISIKLEQTDVTCRPGESVPLKAVCRYSDGSPATSGISIFFELVESIGPGGESLLTETDGAPLGRSYEMEPDLSGEAVVNITASEKCGTFNVRVTVGGNNELFTVYIAPGEPETIQIESDDYSPAPGSTIGIRVLVLDAFCNPVPGEFVAVTIEEHSGDPGLFDGETSGTTDENGEMRLLWTSPSTIGASVKISASNPSVASFSVTPAEITVSSVDAGDALSAHNEYAVVDDSYQDSYQDSGDAYSDMASDGPIAPLSPPKPFLADNFEEQETYEEDFQDDTYQQESTEGVYMEQEYETSSSDYDENNDNSGYTEHEQSAPPPPPGTAQSYGDFSVDTDETDEAEYYMQDESDPYTIPVFEIATGRKANPTVGKLFRKTVALCIVGVLLIPIGYYGWIASKYMKYQFYISKARTAVLASSPGKQSNAEAMMYYEKAHLLDDKQIYPMAKLAQIHIMNMEKLKKSNNIKNLEIEGKKAEAFLNQIITLEPKNYDAIYDLGKLYELNEEYCKAQDQYIKALSIDKSYEAAEAKKSEMRAKCNMQQKMKTGRYGGK